MGQYYRVINLDKREYLDPWAFDNGAKLMEIALSTGIAGALLMLTASGNGRGGGDLIRSVTPDVPKFANEVVSGSFTTSAGKEIEHRVPRLVGSWAGDRIVTAGDYDDGHKFFDEAGVTEEMIEESFQRYKAHVEAHETDPDFIARRLANYRDELNLWHLCDDEIGFTNISEDAQMALMNDQWVANDALKADKERGKYDKEMNPRIKRHAQRVAKAEHYSY